jgi:hypothetical protein
MNRNSIYKTIFKFIKNTCSSFLRAINAKYVDDLWSHGAVTKQKLKAI